MALKVRCASPLEEMAIAPGTIVTVSDLFNSWKARRQAPALDATAQGRCLSESNRLRCAIRR